MGAFTPTERRARNAHVLVIGGSVVLSVVQVSAMAMHAHGALVTATNTAIGHRRMIGEFWVPAFSVSSLYTMEQLSCAKAYSQRSRTGKTTLFERICPQYLKHGFVDL